jgi:hypothetical protein
MFSFHRLIIVQYPPSRHVCYHLFLLHNRLHCMLNSYHIIAIINNSLI